MQGIAKRDVTYAAPDYRARTHSALSSSSSLLSEESFPPHRDHDESTVASRLIPSLVPESVPVLRPFPPFVRKVSSYVTSRRVQLAAETSGAVTMPGFDELSSRIAGRRRNELPRIRADKSLTKTVSQDIHLDR